MESVNPYASSMLSPQEMQRLSIVQGRKLTREEIIKLIGIVATGVATGAAFLALKDHDNASAAFLGMSSLAGFKYLDIRCNGNPSETRLRMDSQLQA